MAVEIHGQGSFDFVALRGGDGGAWTKLESDASGIFAGSVPTATYELVAVCTPSAGPLQRVQYFGTSRTSITNLVGCFPAAPMSVVTGTVTGALADDEVNVDSGFDAADAGSGGSYSVSATMSAGSVLASATTGGDAATTRVARHAYDATSGTGMANIDLATEAHPLVETALHLTGIDETTALATDSYLEVPTTGAFYFLGASIEWTSGPVTYRAVPPEARLVGDRVTIVASAIDTSPLAITPAYGQRAMYIAEIDREMSFRFPTPIFFGTPRVEDNSLEWTLPGESRSSIANDEVQVFIQSDAVTLRGVAEPGYLATHTSLLLDSPTELPGWPAAASFPADLYWSVELLALQGNATISAGTFGTLGHFARGAERRPRPLLRGAP